MGFIEKLFPFCPGPMSAGEACMKIRKDLDEEKKAEFVPAATTSNSPWPALTAFDGDQSAASTTPQWRPRMQFEDGRRYEGQWLGEARHGRGKEESKFGDFVYEGDFKNDRYDGQGIMSWANGAKYMGQFLNNEKHGMGKEHYGQGDKFIGEYQNGTMNGRGQYIKEDGTSIKGVWNNGQLVKSLESFGNSFKLNLSSLNFDHIGSKNPQN